MEGFQQLWAVVVVLGVLCGGLWLLKRKGWAHTALRRGAGDGWPRLEIVDRLPLTPQHSLHLVRWADRTLLIGLSPNGCNLLESTPSAAASSGGREMKVRTGSARPSKMPETGEGSDEPGSVVRASSLEDALRTH